MRDEVEVAGVTLTRAQVEQALKDLNAPEVRFEHGDIVKHLPTGYTGVIIGNDTFVGGATHVGARPDLCGEIRMLAIGRNSTKSTYTAHPRKFELISKAPVK